MEAFSGVWVERLEVSDMQRDIVAQITWQRAEIKGTLGKLKGSIFFLSYCQNI